MKKCLRSVKYSCTSYDNTFKVAKVLKYEKNVRGLKSFLGQNSEQIFKVSKANLDERMKKCVRSLNFSCITY